MICPFSSPQARPAARPVTAWRRLLALLLLVGASGPGCGAHSSGATGAYVVSSSPELARSLEALRGVEQRWALMRQSLASANATYDNMAEAWNLVLDAVATSEPVRSHGSTTAPTEAEPSCGEVAMAVGEQLAEVQRALMGRRQTLSPATLELHRQEQELTRAARALPPRAVCPAPTEPPGQPDDAP